MERVSSRASTKHRRRPVSQTARVAPRRTHQPPRPSDVRRTRRGVLLTLYGLLVVEIIAAVLTSPLLTLKRVTVDGLNTLPSAEAQATLEATHLPTGIHWLHAPTRTVAEKLRKFPWIASATVDRRFPNTMTVQVVPRRPEILIKTGGRTWEADNSGIPIRLARPALLNRLPRLVLDSNPAVIPGVSLATPALLAAVKTHRMLRDDTHIRLAKIEIDGTGNLCLNKEDGVPFHFGQPEDIETKVKLVRAICAREPHLAERIASVNLTCPASPACTPRIRETSMAQNWLPFGIMP